MIAIDEDALVCDLAETYQIYDYRQLPLMRVAVLASGLRENSRIKMKMSEQTVTTEIMLLAGIHDRLSLLVWSQTKDAEKGKNRPQMLTDLLLNKTNESEVQAFNSSEEFEKERQRIIGGE